MTTYNLDNILDIIDCIQPTCICGEKLRSKDLALYGPHDGGILIEDIPVKIWIYFSCSKCGYHLSLSKILHKHLNNQNHPTQTEPQWEPET